MTHQSTSQVPPPPLPPSISFNRQASEDGGRHFFSEWDRYAALEAQRKNALPPGLESPRTVINFFRDLLPDPEVEDEQDNFEENANATNANIVEDDVVEEHIQQPTTQATFVIEHVPPATVPRHDKALRCSKEQMEHIKKYRSKIDAGLCDEFYKDWTNVCLKKIRAGPNKKKYRASDFYIKKSMVWIPHLLIDGHIPCCPTCGTNEFVNAANYWWVDFPLICYTMTGHAYLDTVRYPCSKCNKRFRATNMKSMAMDKTGGVRAKFRIYMLQRCAVDENLFYHIIENHDQPVLRLLKKYKGVIARKYVSDVIEFLLAVKMNMTINQNSISQPRIDVAIANANTQQQQQQQSSTRIRMTAEEQRVRFRLMSRLSSASSSAEDEFPFDTMLKDKKKKKVTSMSFSLGPKKLQMLIDCGIHSGRQLLELYDSMPNERMKRLKRQLAGKDKVKDGIIKGWVDNIKQEISKRETALEQVRKEVEEHAETAAMTDNNTAADEMDTTVLPEENNRPMTINNADDGGGNTPVVEEEEPTITPPIVLTVPPDAGTATATPAQTQLPKFSKMLDRNGYNARFITRNMIDDILQTYFLWRKPIMIKKMLGLSAIIISLDANYKMGKRVVVYDKERGYFRPWVGYITILNEHKQCIWWGMIKNSESIEEIRPHLVRLKARCEQLGSEIKVIYVDNCCTVRNKLQEIFPNAKICLDLFHWLVRWDEIFNDKTCSDYFKFRAFMSRAILLVSDAEYKEQKEVLQNKLSRQPTVKEVLQRCNTTFPTVEDATRSVKAIMSFFMLSECEKLTLASGLDDDDPAKASYKPLLKPNAVVQKVLKRQIKHVDCLIPPPEVVMHYKTTTGKVFKAAMSSANEGLHQNWNRTVFKGTRVGLSRADRGMWWFLDDREESVNINRLGAENDYTTNLESKALANSLAEDIGYEKIFSNASLPNVPDSDEVFGFELDRDLFKLSQQPGSDPPQEDSEELESTNDESEDNNDMDDQERAVAAQISSDVCNMNTAFDTVMSRNVSHQPTSLQSFFKFAGDRPWIPFSVEGTGATEIEERRIFSEMSKNYSRTVLPSAEKGYNNFMKEWNEESGRRYISRLTDESVTIIYRKSLKQLQDYHDKLQDIRTASMQAQDSGDRRLHNLHQVLRQAQKNTVPPVIQDATPRMYPDGDASNIPSGHPFVLNSSASMATVGRQKRSRGVTSSIAPYDVPVAVAAKQPCTDESRSKKKGTVAVSNACLPKGLSFRQICKVCGRKRNDHLYDKKSRKNMFGENKCHWKTCGRCGAEKQNHDAHTTIMGYFCSLTVAQGAIPGQSIHYDNVVHRN